MKINVVLNPEKSFFFSVRFSKEKQIGLLTVFIRLSAQGAYLIFGLSGWALIRGGRLFEMGAYSRLGGY